MEQALLDALKTFGPTAIIVAVPCFVVIRALWNENARKDGVILAVLEKSIEARIQGTVAINAVTDAVRAAATKIDIILTKGSV